MILTDWFATMDHSNDLHVGQVRRMPERIPMVDEMEEETEEELEEEWRLLKAMFSYKLKKSRREEPLVDGWIISPPPLAEPESLGHFESLGHPLFQHSLDDADLTDVEEEEEEEEERKEEKQVTHTEKPPVSQVKQVALPAWRSGPLGIRLLFRHLPFCSDLPVL